MDPITNRQSQNFIRINLTIEKAYNLAQAMGYILKNNTNRDALRLKLTHEYDKVRESQFKSFRPKARYIPFLDYFQ